MFLRNQPAHSFDVNVGSASKNMNLIECLILLLVISSIDLDTANTLPCGIVHAFSCTPCIDLFAKL